MNELLRRLLFLPPQGSTMAREIDGLHYFVIITTMIGAFLRSEERRVGKECRL